MLAKIADRFQTVALVGVVVLLSSVFILQFGGNQADGLTSGGSTYAAEVDGETIGVGEYASLYRLARFGERSPEEQRRQRLWLAALDGLIESHLLAAEAHKLGFRVTEQEVMDRLADERTMRISLGANAPYPVREIQVPVADSDGNFDPELAKAFIQNYLRRSVADFTEAQIREGLAERMRETVVGSVQVSPQEVWEAYEREQDRAKISYVRFNPAFYRQNLEVTDEALSAWMAEHTEEVNSEYENNRHRYTDLEPQVRARHILVKAGRDAAEDVRSEARGRAEALLARAQAGEDFAALATENSEDEGSARQGGDLGFNPRGRMVTEFDESQFSLEVGAISEIVETRFGFHIIKVEAKREGDVPEEEAKRELSERLFRDARTEELVQEAAAAALAQLQGGMSIEDLEAWLVAQRSPAGEGEELTDEAAPEEAEEEEEVEVDPLAPKVEESRLFGRGDNPIRGPFDSSALVRDVFEHDMENPLPSEPIQLGNDFIVYQVTERTAADREEFDDEIQTRLHQGLLAAKQREALDLYVADLREEADRAGRIDITNHVLEVAVQGSGTVTSDPEGITCGNDCNAAVPFGTMVQLRAEPAPGGRFLGWEGACAGREDTCIVSVLNAENVIARFRNAPESPAASEAAPEAEATEEEGEASAE